MQQMDQKLSQSVGNQTTISYQHQQASQPLTQQPESQPTELALSPLNDDHPFDCDDNDNVFFISSSDDKRQLEVNARVIHGTRPLKIKDFILSDDEDDGFLSYYESDDNEYNVWSDEETNEIL